MLLNPSPIWHYQGQTDSVSTPSSVKTVCVGLLDDDVVFRAVIRSVLESTGEVHVVHEWSSASQLLQEEPWHGIDVIVSDLILGEIGNPNPVPALVHFAESTGGTGVILLSSLDVMPHTLGIPAHLASRFASIRKHAGLTPADIIARIRGLRIS